jgi:cobalt-zinc-cadmium efflux system membrane fusion protein
VGSLIEGVVVDVLVQPGTRVRAGQVLARMHSHDVHEAWAGYRKAQAEERSLATELRFASEAEARAQRPYADAPAAFCVRPNGEYAPITGAFIPS